MRITGKRLTVAAILWVLLCFLILAGALPAAGETVEPVPQDTDGMISDGAIHIRYARAEKKDGILSVTVTFTVDGTYRPGDLLWLTVSCGGQSGAYPLKETDREELYSITLSGCREPDQVWVEISGFQRGADGGLYPVHDADTAFVEGDRILKLHLEPGQVCDLYLVGEIWELLAGYLVLGIPPTPEELDHYATEGNHVTTWVANEEGLISCNFTENCYPDGVYLLWVEGSDHPFYVTIPNVDVHGEVLGYTVEAVGKPE